MKGGRRTEALDQLRTCTSEKPCMGRREIPGCLDPKRLAEGTVSARKLDSRVLIMPSLDATTRISGGEPIASALAPVAPSKRRPVSCLAPLGGCMSGSAALHCLSAQEGRCVQPRPRRGWLVLLPGIRLCQLSVQPLSFSLLFAFSFAFSPTVRRSTPTTQHPHRTARNLALSSLLALLSSAAGLRAASSPLPGSAPLHPSHPPSLSGFLLLPPPVVE